MEISLEQYNRMAERLTELEYKEAEQRWIPCSERLPEKAGYYLTTTIYREVYCDYWNRENFNRTEIVIAWRPLPEPYGKDDEADG